MSEHVFPSTIPNGEVLAFADALREHYDEVAVYFEYPARRVTEQVQRSSARVHSALKHLPASVVAKYAN